MLEAALNIELDLIVSLKITDVVAHTAFTTLTRRQSCDSLESLARDDFYRLEIEASSEEEALSFGHRVIAETSCFVNPNKHRYTLAAGGLAGDKDPRRVRLLVEWLQDGTAAILTESLGLDPRFDGRIRDVSRGTLWTLVFKPGFQGDVRQAAEEIAIARDARTGLLANPHSQRVKIGV